MIPFNRAAFDGKELDYLAEAVASGYTAGNGPFSKRAEQLLEDVNGEGRTLLTTSCTHALELAARLLELQPGDEVIVPSFTFVTTASAFLWNGARPVFADIRPDTQNLDVDSVRSLITPRTRAICAVHYAGVGAEPDRLVALARENGLVLIEDNAHGLGGAYRDVPLGTFGDLATLSFHETKNLTCGEGGALVINDPSLVERAEILREKGTDRSKFLRGQVDKYTWVDNGSSWVLSDLLAAVLVGQLERFDEIQAARMHRWVKYDASLSAWAQEWGVKQPFIPDHSRHTAHMYYLVLPTQGDRDDFIAHLKSRGVMSVFHYQPLNESPMGRAIAGENSHCPVSHATANRLVRLPLFASLTDSEQETVIQAVTTFRPRGGL